MGGFDLGAQIAAGSVAFFGGPPPAALPAGAFWERWFLEAPLWPAVTLAAAGVVGFLVLNRAGQARRGMLAAAAGVVAAVAVMVLGSAVTTERERLQAATESLVGAVARGDARAAGEHLAGDVRLQPPPVIGRAGMGRDEILSFVGGEMRGAFKIGNFRVLETQAAVTGPNAARTQTYVRVTPEQTGGPTFSWWRLDWRRDPDGRWRVTHIEPLNADDR